MKQKRLVSVISALVLMISTVLVMTGCQNPSGSATNTILIKFDNTKIKCSDMQEKDIPNGTTLATGTEVKFKAINIPTGQIIDKWTIGKKIRNATSSTTWYEILKDDAVGNTINVSYSLKIPAKLKIVFDASIQEIDGKLKEIANSFSSRNTNCEKLYNLQSNCIKLIQEIHNN